MDRTVLIVDEDVNAQIIAETLLQLRGFHVRLAGDGPEAREIVEREEIAVVVLDLSLPGANGFELLRRLGARFGPLALRSRPRIVALARRHQPEIERFALRLGADACLRKPLDPGQFIVTVENLAGDATAPQARMRTAI